MFLQQTRLCLALAGSHLGTTSEIANCAVASFINSSAESFLVNKFFMKRLLLDGFD